MSKVFVVGSGGYVGQALALAMKAHGHRSIRVGRKENLHFDLEHPLDFEYEALREDDFVILSAAVSSPDRCANDFEYCWNVNVEGSSQFIANVLAKGSKVIFISSDAVYAPSFDCTYNEESPTRPMFPYGKMKAEVERRFLESKNFKAIRLSYVFSKSDRFTRYLLEKAEKGSHAEIFHPYYRNSISISEVSRTVAWLIANWESFSPSILNLAGSELVSRIRVADEVKRLYPSTFDYDIVDAPSKFYDTRSPIIQIESLYLYEFGILEHESFTKRFQRELKKGIDDD